MPWLMVAAVSVVPSRALAEGLYFSESVGGGVVKDELRDYGDSTFRARFALGWRAKHHAVEVWIAPELMFETDDTLVSAGVDAKYLWPLGRHVELYLRGSASRMWVEEVDGIGEPSGLRDYGGRGLGVGTGIQVSGEVPLIGLLAWPLFFVNRGPKVHMGAWFEQGYDFYRLRRDPGERVIDAQITRWSGGISMGQAF